MPARGNLAAVSPDARSERAAVLDGRLPARRLPAVRRVAHAARCRARAAVPDRRDGASRAGWAIGSFFAQLADLQNRPVDVSGASAAMVVTIKGIALAFGVIGLITALMWKPAKRPRATARRVMQSREPPHVHRLDAGRHRPTADVRAVDRLSRMGVRPDGRVPDGPRQGPRDGRTARARRVAARDRRVGRMGARHHAGRMVRGRTAVRHGRRSLGPHAHDGADDPDLLGVHRPDRPRADAHAAADPPLHRRARHRRRMGRGRVDDRGGLPESVARARRGHSAVGGRHRILRGDPAGVSGRRQLALRVLRRRDSRVPRARRATRTPRARSVGRSAESREGAASPATTPLRRIARRRVRRAGTAAAIAARDRARDRRHLRLLGHELLGELAVHRAAARARRRAGRDRVGRAPRR